MALAKAKANRKDIKKAIKAFIHRVELLESETDEDPEVNGFGAEYKLIQDAQIRNKRDNLFSSDAGNTERNLKKNRYKDILPYDDHRVVLSAFEGDPDSSYINASKLMGVRGTGGYIATQGPLATTVNDFWRMIWEYKVEIVFMACKIVELGKIKCKQYWNDVDKTEEFDEITVFTEKEEKIMSDCQRRYFRVTKGEEVRHVVQYHYSGWPDHGIPKDAGHIRDMIGLMRQTRQNDQAPLLVHCSAGCGRTGAIIAIDYVWTLLEEGKFDDTFNLFDLICNFREQRMSIVQTADQYALVNKVLKSLCEEWLTRMASHTYENVEVDQVSGVNGDSSSVTNSPSATGENVYQDAVSASNHSPPEKSTQSPGKSPVTEQGPVDGLRGHTFGAIQASEVNKGNYPAYGNVQQGADTHLEGVAPQKPLPANTASSELPPAHRTIVRADLGSPTRQAQTSDLGGPRVVPYESPYAEVLDQPPVFNGDQPKVHPSQAHLADTYIYSAVDKKGTRSASDNAPVYSAVDKKGTRSASDNAPVYSAVDKNGTRSASDNAPVYSAVDKKGTKLAPDNSFVYSLAKIKASKAPPPPPQSHKNHPSESESVYSVANKKPTPTLPGARPVLPPKRSNLSSSDDKSDYSSPWDTGSDSVFTAFEAFVTQNITNNHTVTTANEAATTPYETVTTANEAATTPYEIINFPDISKKSASIGSAGASREKNFSTSSSILSVGQISSETIPGFNQRLPRVRGPVPMPQTWNKI